MSGPPTVRDAADGDEEGLSRLLEVLGYPAPPLLVAERLAALRAADPGGRVLVAVDAHDRIAGFAVLHMTPVLHRAAAVGRITALAVDASLQGSGVGRRLVEASENWFRAMGLARVEVTSGTTHVPAYDFYRHLGYADHGIRFAKTL